MRRAVSRSARQHRRRFARQPKYKIQILIKYKIQILTKYKIQILTKYKIQILTKYKTQISTKYKIQIFICKKTGLPDDQRGGVYNRPGPQVYHLLQVLSLVIPVFHILQIPKEDDISTAHSYRPQCSTSQERKCNTVYDTINEQKVPHVAFCTAVDCHHQQLSFDIICLLECLLDEKYLFSSVQEDCDVLHSCQPSPSTIILNNYHLLARLLDEKNLFSL